MSGQIYDPDPIQNAITTAAMEQVGRRTVRVRRSTAVERATRKRGAIPKWVAVFTDTDNLLMYAGLFAYGGATKKAALEDARLIASKWGWDVEDGAAHSHSEPS